MGKVKRQINKAKLFCYAALIIEISVIILCYINKTNDWGKTLSVPVHDAMYGLWTVLLLLIAAGFLICAFFKNVTTEKKLLFIAGSMAIALGILGFFNLVITDSMTIWDAAYRSIQFFVGEFDTAVFENGVVPPLINAARFLALGVTFGAIGVVLLKKKLYHWNIRLFYKDVVIITNEYQDYINDMAARFMKRGRKVVIGYTDAAGEPVIGSLDGAIPVVYIDINNNIVRGLRSCNTNKAKDIFLLCEDTGDNIKLTKAIFAMFQQSDGAYASGSEAQSLSAMPESINDLFAQYVSLVKKEPVCIDGRRKQPLDQTVCYVQYRTDKERDYYAIDDVFKNRSDRFDTCFINIYDISIRQMLVKSSVRRIIDSANAQTLKQRLRDVNITVAGSGEMLYRTILEITRNCVYHDKTPLKIYHMQCGQECGDMLSNDLRLIGLIEIETVSAKELKAKQCMIDQYFISADDEKEAGAILQEIFKYDLQNQICDYLILTMGHAVEYEILQNMIKTLIDPYTQGDKTLDKENQSNLYLSSVADLLMSIDRFYKRFAPAATQIHAAYSKAIVNVRLRDFNKLPERFIESSILSALHIHSIMDIIDGVIAQAGEDKLVILEALEYLAVTEHERWYNERSLQGCVFSKESHQIYNQNARLLHWDQLSPQHKEDNLRYVVGAMITQREKDMQSNICDDMIIKYTL